MANNPYVSKVQYGNNVLIDLTSDTVAANKMLSGTTAHDKSGAVVTGNIPSKSGQTYTPTTSAQIIPTGRYLSGDQIIQGSANLLAENIKKDVNIFGVVGTLESGGGARLPAEYQEVEYIQTDGYAYIDTGYSYSGDAEVEMIIYKSSTAGARIFGAVENNSINRFQIGSSSSTNLQLYGTNTDGTIYTSISIPYSSTDNQWFHLKARMQSSSMGLIDVGHIKGIYSDIQPSATPLSASCYFLAENYNGTARISSGMRGKMLAIWDGANKLLVRDLVPCYRKADNVIGMYDLAAASGGTVFYTNAGSGAFTKGADV